MTVIRLACPTCNRCYELAPAETLLMVCRDHAALNTLGFDCDFCGPQVRPIRDPDAFHKLDVAGCPTRYWSLSEVREWGDRLQDTLDRILDEAC